jgi:hypothetical protein
MNEDLLQYIWLSGFFDMNALRTTDGKSIEILKRGRINKDAGPDFLNAHLKIDDTLWIGNVEIHLLSSLWNAHLHQLDEAYNNTILHVVLKEDTPCFRNDGSVLPCLEIGERINHQIISKYEFLKQNSLWVPCADMLSKLDHFTVTQMLDRMMIQRLEHKSELVREWLNKVQNDWHSVFYFALSRSFGFGTNSEAFEQLALNLPLSILAKYKNNIQQLEALIYGVAGFLNQEAKDDYHHTLQKEWLFLSKKHQLKSPDFNTFKLMRMRPGNFPTLRLAQFAALIHQSHHLLSKVLEEDNVLNIIQFFKIETSEYWHYHYVFGRDSKKHASGLSISAIQNIMINGVVPILFVYGQMIGNESICQKALNILHQLPSENNQIIKQWSQFGIHSRTAFDSQALIELKKNYCDMKKCLQCKIGNKILVN